MRPTPEPIIPCLCLFRAQLEFLTLNGPERIDIRTYLENRRTWQDPQRLLTAIYLPLTDGLDSCFKKLGSRAEVTIAQISCQRLTVEIQNIRYELTRRKSCSVQKHSVSGKENRLRSP